MNINDYITKYESKTGEYFNVPDGFQLAFDEKHGFFVFGFTEWNGKAWLQFGATCVDSWQWVFDSVKDTVIMNNLAGCLTKTNRNPKAYAKLTGAKYQGLDDDGSHIFTWEVSDVQL